MAKEQTTIRLWQRDVLAWCCYDWANSGYTTLMITVFTVYIQRVVFEREAWGDVGPIVWAWGVALSTLVGAILSPIVGAMADAHANKRIWLAWSAMLGGLTCVLMACVSPHQTWVVVGCFLIANLCLELSLTFYNGFLPEIADDDAMNRVSAAGMGWGYLGGGLALILAMGLLMFGERFGIELASDRLRICIFGTGVWWAVFSLPTIWFLKDRSTHSVNRSSFVAVGKSAFLEVVRTFKQLRQYSVLLLFLVAFLFYNDGVQTVISQSSTFAIQELDFLDSELVAVILMVQFVAAPGAIFAGWLADRIGQKAALLIFIAIWIALLVSAAFIHSKPGYWAMAFVVALVLGGIQSVSRSVMGRLTPGRHAAKFFGLFNFSGKATSFMGTFTFGLVIAATGSARWALVALLTFFALGFLILLWVKLDLGVQQRDFFENKN